MTIKMRDDELIPPVLTVEHGPDNAAVFFEDGKVVCVDAQWWGRGLREYGYLAELPGRTCRFSTAVAAACSVYCHRYLVRLTEARMAQVDEKLRLAQDGRWTYRRDMPDFQKRYRASEMMARRRASRVLAEFAGCEVAR